MEDRRLLNVVADRFALFRRVRILRHRTARWFQPPVRTGTSEPFHELSGSLPTGSSRRNTPSSAR